MRILSSLAIICGIVFLVHETAAAQSRGKAWEFLKKKYDGNNDGRISPKEYDRGEEPFRRLDQDGDGFITKEDIAARRGSGTPAGKAQPKP